MNKIISRTVSIAVVLAGIGWYFFYYQDTSAVPESREVRSGREEPAPGPSLSRTPGPRSETAVGKAGTSAPAHQPKNIEEIKQQVYALNIETVDDLPLLDRVVQTGDAPTREFWHGDWVSVDDRKDEVNGFFLQPQEDGTFISFPDEATTRTYTFFEIPRTYTYDPGRREFSWQTDYYGKTITHRIRFINDKVMAMMLVSGEKVVLDLYQRGPGKQE